ncbi:MAG TPA: hypothetical protein VEK08_10695 [Planctomycetota bacterium]|nr:hypothetical protein [Planctomycetota bacterium]
MLMLRLCLAAGLVSGIVHSEENENLLKILQTDGSVALLRSLETDTYERVSGIYKNGATFSAPAHKITRVDYPFSFWQQGCAMREEGRHILAAMYFQKMLDAAGAQRWAAHAGNLGLADSLYDLGAFKGYKGKAGTAFEPPSVYYLRALEAHPQMRSIGETSVRLVECLIHQGELAEAERALESGKRRISEYSRVIRLHAGYEPAVRRAQARLACVKAELASARARKGDAQWADAAREWQSALGACEKFPDLLATAYEQYFGSLAEKGSHAETAQAAQLAIAKFGGEPGHETLLAAAHLALGKALLARGVSLQQGQHEIAAQLDFAEARWNFLTVVARYFESDMHVAAAHYFAGLCFEKRTPLESGAAKRARGEWKTVLHVFPRSAFGELAKAKLAAR